MPEAVSLERRKILKVFGTNLVFPKGSINIFVAGVGKGTNSRNPGLQIMEKFQKTLSI